MGIKIVFLLCLLSLTLQMNNIECNVEGCQSCSAPNVCEVCQQNYILQSESNIASTCLRTDCSQNCDTCNQDNQCLTCVDGFLLSQTGSCTSEEQVAQSQRRFLQGNMNGNQTNGNFTNCTIIGCQVCGNAGICSTCKTGFQKTSSGSCMSCNVVGCMFCSSVDVCAGCVQDANKLTPSPNGGACFPCDRNRTSMQGCTNCNGTNSCGLCANGLKIFRIQEQGVCIKCPILNCQSCGVQSLDSAVPICTKCNPGFSVSPQGNSCIQCLFPCDTCMPIVGPNNCATCARPLFFAQANLNGSCIKNPIKGCIAPNQANFSLCAQCAPGFNLATDGSKCNWNCPLNCVSCSSNISCSVCTKGFSVNSTNLCGECKSKGCSACSADGNTCNTCVKGFYILGSECKACPGFCLDCTSNTTCSQLAERKNQVLLIIGGKTVLAVCESICITCSNLNSANCLECTDGFFLEAGKCKKCSGNCKSCDTTNRATCLSCYPNTFLSAANTCVSCNSNCMTCLNGDNPKNCTTCWDGFYLNGTQCSQGCPKNCFTCSNLTTCIQCRSGYTTFVKDSNVICAPCMSSCRSCAEGRPSTCLSCGTGFYLLNVTCKPCIANCAECTTGKTCLTCSPGFFMTSEQTCAMNCILPCATCSTTDSGACQSCIAGYTFNDVSKLCVEVTTCEGDCIACPMGYSLKNGQCLACTTSKCQACNENSLGQCFSCKPGFFLNDAGSCEACPAQCRTCLSATGCTICSSGFTQKENAVATAGGFECLKCNSPCATCTNTPDYCSSCLQGFDFFGWKCAQKFRFTFGLTLTITLSFFEANYMKMIQALAGALKVQDTNAITITSITEGSVIVNAEAAPTGPAGSSQAGDQFASLSNLVNSGNIAGMTIGESTIVVSDGVIGSVESGSKTNVLAIVLGICIPIGVLIIIGIIVFVIYKKKAAEKIRDFDTEEERKNGVFNNTNDKIVN